MDKIIQKIQEKFSLPENLVTELGKLPMSGLNSLLLEVFRQQSRQLSAPELLQQYLKNRFVAPSALDALRIRETELDWLRHADEKGFKPLLLSPLSPLGTCSVMGYVDQNNVVSALRGTEVLADATNVLALQVAADVRQHKDRRAIYRYATVHRHVRSQFFTNPGYTAHFSVFCLAAGGFDRGNYVFELGQLQEQLSLLFQLLQTRFDPADLSLRFYLKGEVPHLRKALQEPGETCWRDKRFEWVEDPGHHYYRDFQFKIFLEKDGRKLDLADGGMVDWTQQLLGNKKHRLLISAIGMELVEKLADHLT